MDAPAGETGTPVARPRSLDALNFFLADVRGALGPYLNVFLVTQRHWSQTDVGLVTTLSGVVGLLAQTPAGALIDRTTRKREFVAAALLVLAAGALAIWSRPDFWPVMVANTGVAVVGDVFGPAVGALTLGLTVRAALARRIGRNSAFDHAGNVAIAVGAAAVGHVASQRAVFLLVPATAVLAIAAVLSIPHRAIDQERARGADEERGEDRAIGGVAALLGNRALVIFGLCAMLFHFGNAPMLPLVGQKLAQAHPHWGTTMMSSCIIAAQLIMLPVALIVGRTADRIGRKPILLVGFAVLPVRAVLYTLSDHSAWLIGVQLLDGVGAGIYGAITPLVIADAMRGTGRFNLAQGAVATMQGIGASLSGLFAGVVVDGFGYSAGFLSLGGAACLALGVLAVWMPETRERPGVSPLDPPKGSHP